MALPEVKNLKNARYLIGYKATQKSMRPDCIQDLSSLNGTGPVERLGTNNGKKKKNIKSSNTESGLVGTYQQENDVTSGLV